MNTRSGESVSAQIGKMGVIDLANGNFSLSDGQPFNIKNDSTSPVKLSVQLAGIVLDGISSKLTLKVVGIPKS